MSAALRLPLAGQTPPPASLPSLATALSRRRAIFGAVLAPMALASPAARAEVSDQLEQKLDARLVAWCDELPRIDAALSDLFARAPDAELDPRIDALSRRWCAATDGIERTPAHGSAGIAAKARAVRHLAAQGDMEIATPIAASFASDVLRLGSPAGCAVGVLKSEETADVRLTALGAEVDRTLDGAAYALAPVHDDADQNRRLDHAESLLITMSDIPAAEPMGIFAKAKAWLDSDSYDVQEGGTLAESLCNDIERLHKVGGLV